MVNVNQPPHAVVSPNSFFSQRIHLTTEDLPTPRKKSKRRSVQM